jgi:hypothetical protein
MLKMSTTNLTVENEVDFLPQMHYIFFQKSEQAGLDSDNFVWRRLDMQSKGSGTFAVPFDVQYQASITKDNEAIERSQPLSADNEILTVTMDKSAANTQAPMLEKTGIKVEQNFKTMNNIFLIQAPSP